MSTQDHVTPEKPGNLERFARAQDVSTEQSENACEHVHWAFGFK
jgi:hypothetical protein